MIVTSHPSPNHDARPDPLAVDMLVLHYTGMRSPAEALARMCDPAAKVSAHYMIDEDGTILALVPEERRAWHAGVSFWRGRSDTNSRSIGIELVNPGHEFGYRPFPEAQMAALRDLALSILARHPIPPRNVVAHADVAPLRKEDPGELFDWAGLARAGIGLFPSHPPQARDTTLSIAQAQQMLSTYGYDSPVTGVMDEKTKAVVTAFQRHFRPGCIDGRLDSETLAQLTALSELTSQAFSQ